MVNPGYHNKQSPALISVADISPRAWKIILQPCPPSAHSEHCHGLIVDCLPTVHQSVKPKWVSGSIDQWEVYYKIVHRYLGVR